MRFKGIFTVGAISLLFLVGVVAGCGGSEQSNDQQGGGGATSTDESPQATSGGTDGGTVQGLGNASGNKIAVGNIVRVDTDKRRFVVKPAKGENMTFKAVPKVQVELDEKEAELADLEKGQQIQLEYIVREGMSVPNRARSITLFSGG